MAYQNSVEHITAVDLVAQLAAITSDELVHDPAGRAKAIALSKKLIGTLEDPVDRAVNYLFQPFSTSAIRMAVGLKLFDHLCAVQGPVSSAKLSILSGGEEMLISRILRAVASIGFVKQTGPNGWEANEMTNAMTLPPIAAGYRCDVLVRTAMSGTQFLEKTDWKNPSEPRDGFLQYANNTKLHLFDFLASQPSLLADFTLFMGATLGKQDYWCDWYDVKERVLDGYNPQHGEVLLVDVGGGKGHDLQIFHERFAETHSGSLILQDLAPVIDGVHTEMLDSSITKMSHDFFEAQLIKGARAYFLHHILHDWSDKYCLQILKQLRDAMTPGYSKLIIHELVLPDVGATELQARFDLTMMTINSGMERSAHEFTALLESAGFKITGTWSWPDKDGIVEAEMAV